MTDVDSEALAALFKRVHSEQSVPVPRSKGWSAMRFFFGCLVAGVAALAIYSGKVPELIAKTDVAKIAAAFDKAPADDVQPFRLALPEEEDKPAIPNWVTDQYVIRALAGPQHGEPWQQQRQEEPKPQAYSSVEETYTVPMRHMPAVFSHMPHTRPFVTERDEGPCVGMRNCEAILAARPEAVQAVNACRHVLLGQGASASDIETCNKVFSRLPSPTFPSIFSTASGARVRGCMGLSECESRARSNPKILGMVNACRSAFAGRSMRAAHTCDLDVFGEIRKQI